MTDEKEFVQLCSRVPLEVREAFHKKCEENLNNTTQVLRQLIVAYIEDRVTIHKQKD